MLSQISFSLFAQSAQQLPECPPAGASQEVNEVAPSLAAPSASGQQAGTLRLYLAYDGVWWRCSAGGLTVYSCGRAAAIDAWKVEASQWIDSAAARLAGGGAS